jgi:hypothetical protein
VNQWGDRDFGVQANPELTSGDFGEEGQFQNGVECLTEEEEGGFCSFEDPDMEIDLGGFSPPLPSSFNSIADCPNGICDFINHGAPITSLLLTTSLSGISGQTFNCDGLTVFQFCGFTVNSDGELEIAFLKGTGSGIGTATVPEPASGLLLVTGLAAALLTKRRKIAR